MPRYELRLNLQDRPGSFGRVATTLGAAGANIVSLDVIEAHQGVAVDHLVVNLDAGRVEEVSSALAELPGVHVEAFHPVPRRPDFHGPLELIESLVRVPAGDIPQTLVDGLPLSLRVSWAVVFVDRQPQPERLAASVGAPSLVGLVTSWMPLTEARTLDQHGDWVPRRWELSTDEAAIAAAPLGDDGASAVLAVRKTGPSFRQRELRALAALGLVAGRLMESRAETARTS